MPVGEDLINASPQIQDKAAFIQGLNSISDELGVSRDFLPIIMMTEAGTDGINPAANNGNCGGLIQFCNGTGASEVGVDAHTISSMSAVEQLPLIKQYLSTKGIPKGADLATTYLAILTPAAMDASRTENLGITGQADHLYGPDGVMTKESLEAGLLGRAQVNANALGGASAIAGDSKFTPLPSKSGGGNGGSPASLGTNGGAIIIGTYTRDCTKTPPWDWTMQGGKIYRGCALRITTLGVQGGQSTTPMYGAVSGSTKVKLANASLSSTVAAPKAGTLLFPIQKAADGGSIVITDSEGYSEYRQRNHDGIDIGSGGGSQILAAADGVVIEAGPRGTYGNLVIIQHADGSVTGVDTTRYGHMESLLVNAGDTVKAGQPIGIEGNTGGGLSTGTHLHFEVRDVNGTPQNPINYFDPSTTKVAEDPKGILQGGH